MSVQTERQWFKPRLVIPLFVIAAVIMALFQGIFHRRHARGGPVYQANVNESLETALIYVDAAAGSDANPGTSNLPVQTISAGVNLAETNNSNNIGSKVIINPGTYREAVLLQQPRHPTSMPITLQAATNGSVIVSGAQQFTGWQAYAGNNLIYTNTWPYAWGLCNTLSVNAPPAPDIVLRREMIFVNNFPLTQVMTLNQMLVGTFYVDDAGQTIYMWPPNGTDLSTADVEVAILPTVLSIQGQSNIVVRGLTFQYASTCRQSGAVSVSSGGRTISNILFDTDNFLWNNAQGLNLTSSMASFTVQNSVANHNGEGGFQMTKVDGGLFQSDTSSYNNWRGAQGSYYSWGSSGAHFYQMHDLTLNNFTTSYNQTYGMHFDTDNDNITITSMTTYGNLLASLFLEKNQGPVSVTGSTFCGSSALANYNVTYGLSFNDSENTSFTNNTIMNTNIAVYLLDLPGGYAESNWVTGENYQVVNSNLSFTQNTIQGGPGQQLFRAANLSSADWSQFQSTLISNNNTWWNASSSAVFTVSVPNPATTVDFPGWQSATGQDGQSVFQAPGGNPGAACSSAVDAPDYWFIVPSTSSSLTVSPQTPAVFTATVVPLGFNGTVSLSYDGVQNIPGGASASWSASSIGPNQSANFTVTPGATTPSGTYPVTMIANSGNVTRTITAFVVVNNTVQLSQTGLDFGNQLTKTTSAPQSVTVSNSGSMPLSMSAPTFTGGQAGDFSQTNNCGTSLPANSNCTITLTFTPGNTGSRSATLNVNDSDSTSPQQVTLTGTGAQPSASLSPGSYTFVNQAVGTSGTPQPVVLTNTGSASLSITSITVGGANSSDFAQVNNCGSSVAAGASCTINVTFTPTNSGNRSGKITVTDNASPVTQTTTFSGSGVQGGATFSPTMLAFGSQIWNTTSASNPITLTNSGSSPLHISSISVAGSNPADFAQTNNCGAGLTAGTSCTINAAFRPQAIGSRSATVSVADDAAGSPQTVNLLGTGTTSVALSSSALGFGSHKVGAISSVKTVTVTNNGGTALTILNISIGGTNAGDFAQTNTCGGSLSAGAGCTISVTFTAGASGSRSATLNISDNDPASPQQINLSGTGQ